MLTCARRRFAVAPIAFVLASLLALLLAPAPARAENATPPENCPPGSVGRASGAFGWCEPTVCIIDTDCGSGMVCRTLGLCMNVGTVGDAKSDAAGVSRLSVTNVCGTSKSCPSDTVCSEKPRCVETAVAQRMALLPPGQAKPPEAASASSAPSAPSATPSAMMPKKSACGCSVLGARDPRSAWALTGVLIGGAVLVRRRRARRA